MKNERKSLQKIRKQKQLMKQQELKMSLKMHEIN